MGSHYHRPLSDRGLWHYQRAIVSKDWQVKPCSKVAHKFIAVSRFCCGILSLTFSISSSLALGSSMMAPVPLKQIEGIPPKGPYLPCVSMAGLLAGYPRNMGKWIVQMNASRNHYITKYNKIISIISCDTVPCWGVFKHGRYISADGYTAHRAHDVIIMSL